MARATSDSTETGDADYIGRETLLSPPSITPLKLMARFSPLALAGLLIVSSSFSAAQAGGISDIEHLGSGGLCDTNMSTGGLRKIGNDMAVAPAQSNKSCGNLINQIMNTRNREIQSEEKINTRMINSNQTVGLVTGLAPLAVSVLGGLFSAMNRPQPAPQPAADNSRYLQVIQQQQQQIDELRQVMVQRASAPQPQAQPAYSPASDRSTMAVERPTTQQQIDELRQLMMKIASAPQPQAQPAYSPASVRSTMSAERPATLF